MTHCIEHFQVKCMHRVGIFWDKSYHMFGFIYFVWSLVSEDIILGEMTREDGRYMEKRLRLKWEARRNIQLIEEARLQTDRCGVLRGRGVYGELRIAG